MTTALILVPLAAALLVWLLPLPGRALGTLALLVAAAEIVLWVVAVSQYDFDTGGLQLVDRQSWFSDLGVSYHVGFWGFSLWLTGLTVVVCTAAIGYAALGEPGAGAARTSGSSSSCSARSSASSRRRICSSSTSSSRRC